jgi:hypothetical protein
MSAKPPNAPLNGASAFSRNRFERLEFFERLERLALSEIV